MNKKAAHINCSQEVCFMFYKLFKGQSQAKLINGRGIGVCLLNCEKVLEGTTRETCRKQVTLVFEGYVGCMYVSIYVHVYVISASEWACSVCEKY